MARAGSKKKKDDYREIRGIGPHNDSILVRTAERYRRPTDQEMAVLRGKNRLFYLYKLADQAVEAATRRRNRWKEEILGSKQDGPTEFARAVRRTNVGGLFGGGKRPFRALVVKVSPYTVRRRKSRQFVNGALQSGHPEVLAGFEFDAKALLKQLAKTRSKDPQRRLELQLDVLDKLAAWLRDEFGIELWDFIVAKPNQEKLQTALRTKQLTPETRKAVVRKEPTYNLKVDFLK